MTKHTGDTITKVVGNAQQIREFAGRLIDACDEAEAHDEVQHVEGTFTQSEFDGPWKILFHVVNNNG